MRRAIKVLSLPAWTFLFVLFGAAVGHGQTITITAPSSPTSVKEGDDFFTNVMNEPLDFDQRRDFMWEELFNEPTISATAGVWSGSFNTTGGYVFPLFPGFGGGNPLMNVGRTGERFPIDTAKYKYLSVRRRVSANPGRNIQAIYVSQQVSWPVDLLCAGIDGYYTANSGVHFANNQWAIDLFDFRQPLGSQPSPPRCDGGQYNPGRWSGLIRGLRLDPSPGGGPATVADYDWVRVVDPTSAPLATVSWTTTGAPAGSQVNVYVDNDASGKDGSFIGRAPASAGSFVFPSAALPPGTWYFYLEIRSNTGADAVLGASSGYSAAYTVNGRTRVVVNSPSMTSGADYATEFLGNPWDFSDAADVANLNFANDALKRFKNPVFSGGQFTATAVGPVGGASESDVQVWMNVNPAKPIPTYRYRYLTIRMSIDPTLYTNISDKVMKGHIARSFWWNTDLHLDGTATRANVVYEGLWSHTVDLVGTPGLIDGTDTYPAQTGWRGNPTLANLRIDPGEYPFDTVFSMDDVKLRARPEPTGANVFTVSLTTSDLESEQATLQFFRDSDNAGFDGTLVGTLTNRSPGPHTFTFSTAGVFPQDFWIYVVATDSAGNVTRQYGDAPLHVGPQVWQPFFAVNPLETPYVGDFNGDGRTDIITFTRQNPAAFGDVYVALSNGSQFVDKNGNPGSSDKWHDFFAINTSEQVVIGDYDGDGKDDIATWLGATTRQVYVAKSLGTGMGPATVWVSSIGFNPSDVLMSGDANGDGKEDLILFARTQGKVYVALSDGASFGNPTQWHGFFAVSTYERPQVADVNGDGKADIVTFATDSPTAFGDVYVATSDGTRFVDLNGVPSSSSKWHDFFAIRPTEEVRIGDLNDDGKDDFFTFLPAPFGQCYNVLSQGTQMAPNVLWVPEGLYYTSTDRPFVGDVNGDGKADVILFRQVPGKVEVVLTP